MNKTRKMCLVLLASTLCLMIGLMIKDEPAKVQAKTRFSVKGTTLTVSGKGKMTSRWKAPNKQKKKIRRIVIKKGVKSIAYRAFDNCAKVTSIEIPSTVKKIGHYSFRHTAIKSLVIPSSVRVIGQGICDECTSLKDLTIPGNYKEKTIGGDVSSYRPAEHSTFNKVTFNTQLQLEKVSYFKTKNLYVKSDDKKYKSIDGVLYSRDGQDIVRVPSLRKSIEIKDGCKTFCLQSVLYCYFVSEDPVPCCEAIEHITIPSSVTKVDKDKYYAISDDITIPAYDDYTTTDVVTSITIHTAKLDGDSLSQLYAAFPTVGITGLAGQLPSQISEQDGMYITADGVLLAYTGTASQLTLPDTVTSIGERAFFENKSLLKVTLPEGIQTIGDCAFYGCYAMAKDKGLQDINLPSSLTKIGNYAFCEDQALTNIDLTDLVNTQYGAEAFAYTGITECKLPTGITNIPRIFSGCDKLTSLTIPDTVTSIAAYAFCECSSLRSLDLGDGVRQIGAHAFEGTDIQDLNIPACVTTISKKAFHEVSFTGTVQIQGSTAGIHKSAFDTGITFSYGMGISEALCPMEIVSINYRSDKTYAISYEWAKVEGVKGYQVTISSDKKGKRKIKTLSYGTGKRKGKVKGISAKYKNIYVHIRPYTKSGGKRVYGRTETRKVDLP